MSDRGEAFRFWLAGWAGWAVVRALMATVRMRVIGDEHRAGLEEQGIPPVLVCWHGHLLPLVYLRRNQGVVVLASEHRDGEYITRILGRLGFGAARGSSTRGGSRGLRELVRAARSGRILAVTPDGPKGPRHQVKGGALLAARITGRPILPMAAGAGRHWELGSWDRFLIPKPFSTVRVAYGTPIQVPRDADDAVMEGITSRVEAELNRITALCEDPETGG